jgi:hypothetical protein
MLDVLTTSIQELSARLNSGDVTSVELVHLYLGACTETAELSDRDY